MNKKDKKVLYVMLKCLETKADVGDKQLAQFLLFDELGYVLAQAMNINKNNIYVCQVFMPPSNPYIFKAKDDYVLGAKLLSDVNESQCNSLYQYIFASTSEQVKYVLDGVQNSLCPTMDPNMVKPPREKMH